MQPERLQLLAGLLDEGTFTLLAALGVRPGWRCLEVGAGGGSVAAWLAGRVAPEGFVLATDLDTTVLRGLDHPCLQVRTHDIVRDPLPHADFDLVHARLLLAWLARPQAGLAQMAAALKPGGCLLTEEMDFLSLAPDPRLGQAACDLFTRVIGAHHAVLADRHAFDPFRGRRLAGDLAEAGLVNTVCQGRLAIWQGGQPGGRVWQLTLIQLRDEQLTPGWSPPRRSIRSSRYAAIPLVPVPVPGHHRSLGLPPPVTHLREAPWPAQRAALSGRRGPVCTGHRESVLHLVTERVSAAVKHARFGDLAQGGTGRWLRAVVGALAVRDLGSCSQGAPGRCSRRGRASPRSPRSGSAALPCWLIPGRAGGPGPPARGAGQRGAGPRAGGSGRPGRARRDRRMRR